MPSEATRAYDRARYARNREAERERARRYYARNREKKRAYDRMRYRRDRDKILARAAAWRAMNPARGMPRVPRAARLCKRCGAPALSQRHHYCGVCQEWALERRAQSARARARLRDAQRQETTTARGYGTRHQKLRKQWAQKFARGDLIACARCGLIIFPGERWDLGHDDQDRSHYTGPEHERCNRATAARPTRRRVRAPRSNWW